MKLRMNELSFKAACPFPEERVWGKESQIHKLQVMLNFRKLICESLAMLLFLNPVLSFSQKIYPQNYFSSPLTIPLILSGNFGEIRGKHFHSGLDFKTNNKEGLPVVASASGYVYRIKVSAGGYGNALYMQHYNGYTTVYAHLHSFSKQIADTVITLQYAKKKFEVELFPEKDLYFFNKGDTIGLSGNSGGSVAPHLHFEIREAENDKPLNPLLFGLPVNDTLPPVLKNIFVYELTSNSTPKKYNVRTLDGKHYFSEDAIETASPFYLGFNADDFALTDSNNLGIYSALLTKDTDTIYSYVFNQFDFNQTKYVNAHTDYSWKFSNKQIIERCFVVPNNLFTVYGNRYNGRITFSDTATLALKLSDYKGQEILLNSKVSEKRKPVSHNPNKLYYWNQPNIISGTGYSLSIPAKSLFENTHLPISQINFEKDKKFVGGKTYSFSDTPIPLSTSAEIFISKPKVATRLQPKLCLVMIDNEGKLAYIGGTYKNGKVTANVNKIGKFAVAIDSLSPVIEDNYSVITDSVTMGNKLQFKVSDNLSGIKEYNAYLNGSWILMEYDPKSASFFIDQSRVGGKGNDILVLEISDRRNNKTIKTIALKF